MNRLRGRRQTQPNSCYSSDDSHNPPPERIADSCANYLTVALPKITYRIDVWYTPPNKLAEATRNAGSVGMLKSLQLLQRITTLAITGALRTTPTDLLKAHMGVFPLKLTLLKTCHRATVSLLMLPTTHPLHSLIQNATRTT